MAHKRAHWLCHSYRLGGSRNLRAIGNNRNGPQLGRLATPIVPSRGGGGGLQSSKQNEQWRESGQMGCVTPAVRGPQHGLRFENHLLVIFFTGVHFLLLLGGGGGLRRLR